MRTESGHHAGLSVTVVLIGVALVVAGVQADSVFGQAGGTAVVDVCEPTARAVDFNADARSTSRILSGWLSTGEMLMPD